MNTPSSRFLSTAALAIGLLSQSLALAQSVTGAGASFPAPLYAKWAADYHQTTGAKLNYQSIGSSAGLRQIEARTVDFGASDAPLSDEELQRKGLVQFPTVVGGVIPVINIQGIGPGELKLSGQVLGDIYLGKIKHWNDPAITAFNPGLPLPDASITAVRRADGSGTSFAFTSYLSLVNSEWKAQVGEGTAVNWPTGAGGKGNEGVAAFVARLPNSIGYVEYAYVKQNKMSHIRLQNADGFFVDPGEISFKAAAAGADWTQSFHQILNNKPGPDAWPITSATYILMHQKQDRPKQAATVLQFFDWAYENGDSAATELDYVAMPPEVKQLIRDRAWSQVKDGTGQPIPIR